MDGQDRPSEDWTLADGAAVDPTLAKAADPVGSGLLQDAALTGGSTAVATSAPAMTTSAATSAAAPAPAPAAASGAAPLPEPSATLLASASATLQASAAPATGSAETSGGAASPTVLATAWNPDWRSADTSLPGEEEHVGTYYQPQPVPKSGQPATPSTPTSPGAPTAPGTDGVIVSPTADGAVTATSNAIVLENQLPGTPESEWLISEGDPSIEGYAAQFSLNHGETVDFKINTDSTNYRIDIYRLGYYGGNGARKVASFDRVLGSAQVQPDPLFDPATRLVDAGNWAVSASWAIPADAVSGVYFAELTRLDGSGGRNMIPFIVRDDDAPSDITFQTSDTTWQAYNIWGGYNFYGGVDEPGNAGRASKLSYNRPIVTRDGGFASGPQDFIFGVEYPTIRWLERNGYDVNYISGIDTDRDPAQLLNSQVFLSVGHDEYWSAGQRANVEAARDAGVNLAFLSGNEVYWQTRWETSIDGTGTPYKTLVSYKERWDNDDTDPGYTTSTWRDAQLGAGQPENGLTGTIFTVDSYRLDTIEIPYDLSNFRFWTNTAVADILPGETYSLTPNLLGYEWDSDLDNGARPDGLINLSHTTVDVESLLLDYGATTGAGTATHALTLYRAPSGALVFGAGSVYWSWGLDSHHDNEVTPTDPNVQQAMVNLFADMGVQPETLMSSLVVATQTTDTTAPVSTITLPAEPLVAGTRVQLTGTATDSGGGTVAVVEVSTDGGATWHRATGYESWSYGWTPLAGGTYDLMSRAVDDSVNLETPGTPVEAVVADATLVSIFDTSDVPDAPVGYDQGQINLGITFTSSAAGSLVGMRYYKSIGDGGTHVGTIWSSTGVALASATFTAESASGWQTVTFDSPLQINPGVHYVASYTSHGNYPTSDSYFSGPVTSGPLSTVGSGLYDYDDAPVMPAQTTNGTNYWVDVIFSASETANLAPVAGDDSGYLAQTGTPLSLTAASLLANDSDPNGDILSIDGVGGAQNGTVSYDAATDTVTFTANAGYTGAAQFDYTISDGRGGVDTATVSLTVVQPYVTLFPSSATPAVPSDEDSAQVTLGLRFTADTAGTISGIRYYKSASDTGTHTGTLWTSGGTKLATATFANETASGWQTLVFQSPVAITAGTTYVASFHSNGRYASSPGYFATPYSRGPLSAASGANGVYAYGSGDPFPTGTYNNSNYWVDVLFNPASGTNQPPVAVDDSGYSTPRDTAVQIGAAALLANDSDPEGGTLSLTGVSGAQGGTVAYNGAGGVVTFTPTAGYSGPASFTYTVADPEGATATATVSLTVTAPDNQPPVAVDDSGYSTPGGTALQIGAAALLANDSDPDGDTLTLTGVSGGVNGTASYDAGSGTVTFTPTGGYTGPASFSYAIADGRGGTASAQVSLTVTEPPVYETLFAAGAVPGTITVNDASAVELGMKFQSAVSGTITGIRFYKGPQNTGTHTGSLWTATGTRLGNVTFTNETASGWQMATFASPIAIQAGTTYVASYHTNTGYYSVDQGFFSSPYSNGSLSAPDTGSSGGNGVYAYGAGNQFPGQTYSASNYWVDVAFVPDGPVPNRDPVANPDGGLVTAVDTPLEIQAGTLLANDTDADGDALSVTGVSGATHGSAAWDPVAGVVTFTPASGYTGAANFTYAIADGNGGTSSAAVSLSVTASGTTQSVFAAGATPAVASVNDPNPVELGMRFSSDVDGSVLGVRFYKGTQNTGTHTGSLWTATGTRLGNVTFTNETASGWQTANFDAPIAITANTDYVVSYHTGGNYAANENYFSTSVTSGNLTAPASGTGGGNGLYAYGSASAFPTNTWNSSNYWVDVIFTGTLVA